MARDYFDDFRKAARRLDEMTRHLRDVQRSGGFDAFRESERNLEKLDALTRPHPVLDGATRSAVTDMADRAAAVFAGLTQLPAIVEGASRAPGLPPAMRTSA